MNEKIKELVAALISRSIEKQAVWNKTNSVNEFKIVLSNDSALTVDSWFNESENEDSYDLTIYNTRGDMIIRYAYTYKDYVEFQLLKNLHNAAREAYYKVDETLDKMLQEVLFKSTIGDSTPKQAEEEDDNLPF